MKKLLSFTAIILCFSLMLCSCAPTQSQGGDTPKNNIDNSDKNKEENENQSKLNVITPSAYSNIADLKLEPGSYISIIGRYADDSFWSEVEAGAKQAVADINKMLGYKGDDQIKLVYNAPDIRDDVNEQINILGEELSRYPIAIGIAAIDTSACALQFDLAAEDSIPIITFDSGSDYQNVASHISTNNLEAASTAASKLAHALDGAGEIAIIVQDSVSMTASERLPGFTDTLAAQFPEISVVATYHMDQLSTMAETIANEKNLGLAEGEEQMDPASISQEDVIQYILEKNPNLKGIYTTNLDTTQLVADVVTSSEETDLKIVGFDGGEEQLKLLEDGVVEGLVLQNPYGMGYATVVAAARAALDLGNESVVDTGYTWVTKDNMDTASIKQMLY